MSALIFTILRPQARPPVEPCAGRPARPFDRAREFLRLCRRQDATLYGADTPAPVTNLRFQVTVRGAWN